VVSNIFIFKCAGHAFSPAILAVGEANIRIAGTMVEEQDGV